MSYSWSETTDWCHTHRPAPTTLRFLASVSHLRLICYRIAFLTVWTLCHRGWQPIGSSSITTRRNNVTTPSTPDPVQTRTRPRHICATSHYRQEPRCLLGRRCYSARSRDRNYVFYHAVLPGASTLHKRWSKCTMEK